MIKLEFDGQDPTALKHLGQALVNMANEMNGVVVTGGTHEPQIAVDTTKPVTVSQVDDGHVSVGYHVEAVEWNPKYDANGLPWDERIHSGNKTRNADDTWQKRKHNKKDFPSKDDWFAYIAEVEAELQALMSIPVVEAKQDEEVSYPMYWRHDGTDEVGIIRNDEEYEEICGKTGEIIDLISEELFNELRLKNTVETDYTDAPPPPPPVLEQPINPKPEATSQDAPPPPPPEVTSVADAGNTQGDVEASVKFVDITKFITGTIVKNGVKSMPEVTAAITAEYGVPFPALAKREDLWPQVMAFLEKMNNEADTK